MERLKREYKTLVIIILIIVCIVEAVFLISDKKESWTKIEQADEAVSTDSSELTEKSEQIQADDLLQTGNQYYKEYINKNVICIASLSTRSDEFDTELDGNVYIFNDYTGMLVANYKVDKYAWGGIMVEFPTYVNLLNCFSDYIDEYPNAEDDLYEDCYIQTVSMNISENDDPFDQAIWIDFRPGDRGSLDVIGKGAEGTMVVLFEIEEDEFVDGQILMRAYIGTGSVAGPVECVLNLDGDE